ncbi:pyrroline-5-carboxylate reductase [Planctomycetales bacterium ZRK34]|nr:pyrroline-5-carboxylate reductase [Planctomycetales bacterium ZRK34]
MQYELGVIGAGNMAEAIVRAAIDQQIVSPDKIIVSDPSADRRVVFEKLGCATGEHNRHVVDSAAQVMLAVKPQVFPKIVDELQSFDVEHQIVISIMAGLSAKKIADLLGKPLRIVRVMPNTPLLSGLGMSGVALGEHAKPGDELLTMQIFQAAGEAVVLPEPDLDAVTAVSGSGPAYIFYLAEAMAEAAESLGLSAEVADRLTQQTILGAATLLKESDDPAATLRRKVTSPGGTTQAAIEHMETQQVRSHIAEAIRAAAARSKELGK